MLRYNDPFGISLEDRYEEISNKRIGERIRNVRIAKKMTQADLGEKIGLNANRIQQYENATRKPKLSLIKQIAKALEVEPIAFLDPVLTDNIGVMYGLFEMEGCYNLKIKESGRCCYSG